MFSPSTLQLFSELLGQVQIPASHPDLLTVASTVATAKAELADAIALAPAEPPPVAPSQHD